jgi:hypothetical protein
VFQIFIFDTHDEKTYLDRMLVVAKIAMVPTPALAPSDENTIPTLICVSHQNHG